MTPLSPTPATGKAATMSAPEIPDFTIWSMDRLIEQRDHLTSILVASAGQKDPHRSQLWAEVDAIRTEIDRRRKTGCPHHDDDED